MWPLKKKMEPGTWHGQGGPKVLLEHPGGDELIGAVFALRDAGYDVAVCGGPVQPGLKPERCPLLDPEGCPLVEGADVVVTSFDLNRPETRDIVFELRSLRPRKPLVIETSPENAELYPELLTGADLITSPTEPSEVLAAVEKALSKT